MKRIIPLFFLILLILTGCDDNASSVHEVVFDDGYGTTFIQDVEDGKTAVKPYKDPSAPGSAKKGKFKFWITKSSNGAETEYDFSEPVKRDLHLYAVYYDAYTVTFLNGTSFFSEDSVSEGDKLTKPSSSPVDPSMGAFDFWAMDPKRKSETPYDFDTPVTSSFSLYAHYKEAKYITLLDPDGKQIGERIKVSYEDVLPVPDIKECGERLIEKWQVKEGDSWEDYDFSLPVDTDLTLRAVCYDKLPNSSISKEEMLGTAGFAEVLSSLKGNDKEEGTTTAGFKNSDLAKLFLAATHNIDPDTLALRYINGDISYELYIPGESLYVPDNILFYSIESASAARYCRNYDNGEIEVEADNFNISIRLGKGKLENGAVVKDGEYFDTSAITLILNNITLKVDGEGNIDTAFTVGADTCYELTTSSEISDTETVTKFIMNKSNNSSSASGAGKISFYTVTFDPDNGDDVTKIKIPASNGGVSVNKPDLEPWDEELNPSFRYWTKDGVEYDFSSKIDRNTILKARYFSHEDFYNRILVSECIYKIPTILSKYENLYKGWTIVSRIFGDDDVDDDNSRNLGLVLLSSLFYMDSNEKLYVTYNGVKYDYEDNKDDFGVIRPQSQSEIKTNSSSKSGNTEYIKLGGFKITIQFTDKAPSQKLWATFSETISVDATIVTGDNGTKVMTTSLTSGGKTYSTLKTTTTTLSDGRSEVVYEYEGLRFTRIY